MTDLQKQVDRRSAAELLESTPDWAMLAIVAMLVKTHIACPHDAHCANSTRASDDQSVRMQQPSVGPRLGCE